MAGCGRIQNYHLEWPDGSVRDGQIRAWQISINLAVKVKKMGIWPNFLEHRPGIYGNLVNQ